jgi:RNA polymerase sigma factor (sigma-70 family)
MATTDELAALLADDLDAGFTRLVTAHQDAVFSGALRLTRDRAEAEDVAQDAFVRAYRALSGYDPARIRSLNLGGWLWTIVLNVVRNRARSARRAPTVPLGAGDDRPGSAGGTEADALAAVAEAEWQARLAALPPAVRTAVVLRHVVGLGYGEIAEATGRPEGTVKSDVHRGLARLRKIIDQEARP